MQTFTDWQSNQLWKNRLRSKEKLRSAMFLVSLAGPVVFAEVFTQICLSFGWQIACAGSREAQGKDWENCRITEQKLPLCFGVCNFVHLYKLMAFTKVNVKCLHYAQVTLLLNKSSYTKWIPL